MDLYNVVMKSVERDAELISRVGKDIWAHAELGLQEHFAADLLCAELQRHGFTIERPVGGMPTAFTATWGQGSPLIGILAEYDALAKLSQKVSFVKEPLIEGAPGHGCGHNLFGAGSLGAAIAVKDAMVAGKLPGTVRFYGCPAEETLIGKVFMARAGVFDGMDACINWHPGYTNTTGRISSNAMNSFKVHFHGIAAHGAAPHLGRSALDGVELMDNGANFLREHIEQECRIHYVITDGGGAPNIVPPEATVWYYCRAPRREMVDHIYGWLLDIAKGAALMSRTTHDVEVLTACHELVVNHALSDVLQAHMERLGGPQFSDAEKAFATQLQKTVPANLLEGAIDMAINMAGPGVTRADLAGAASEKVLPALKTRLSMGGSTDVGDVSKIAPTCNLSTCTMPVGTPPHSWQTVSASGHDFGARGTVYAAKIMALGAVDLFTKPELVAAAQAEFKETTAGKPYVCALPADAWPHL